jgi:hypothetical protein
MELMFNEASKLDQCSDDRPTSRRMAMDTVMPSDPLDMQVVRRRQLGLRDAQNVKQFGGGSAAARAISRSAHAD